MFVAFKRAATYPQKIKICHGDANVNNKSISFGVITNLALSASGVGMEFARILPEDLLFPTFWGCASIHLFSILL